MSDEFLSDEEVKFFRQQAQKLLTSVSGDLSVELGVGHPDEGQTVLEGAPAEFNIPFMLTRDGVYWVASNPTGQHKLYSRSAKMACRYLVEKWMEQVLDLSTEFPVSRVEKKP